MQTQVQQRHPRARSERCHQMVNILRENFIYSEKRARDFVFSALEAALERSRGQTARPLLSKLTREVAEGARSAAEKAGYEFATWETTTKAVINSMLGAGVLLSEDGAPVRPDVRAQVTPIFGLKPQYRDLTEAYLLEWLIRKLGDIRTRDHKALAHALFRQFDPNISVDDLEDRVIALLATMADRVVLREDGSYAARFT
jgi:hypothetical protein